MDNRKNNNTMYVCYMDTIFFIFHNGLNDCVRDVDFFLLFLISLWVSIQNLSGYCWSSIKMNIRGENATNE